MKIGNILKTALKSVAVVGAVFGSSAVLASTTGSEFQNLHDTFVGWVQGYGGAAISVAAVGLGGLASLARQTPFPILTGIGSAVLLQYSPDVVGLIITATV